MQARFMDLPIGARFRLLQKPEWDIPTQLFMERHGDIIWTKISPRKYRYHKPPGGPLHEAAMTLPSEMVEIV